MIIFISPCIFFSSDSVEKTLKILISYCQNLKALTDNHGLTLIHKAAILGNCQFVKILMEAGLSLNAETKWGATPMDLAVTSGQFAIVGVFISHYETSRYNQLLDNAIRANQKKIVDFLVSRVPDQQPPVNHFGNTSMHYAVRDGKLEMVKSLLSCGWGKSNLQNQFLLSPLHIAVGEYANIMKNARKASNSNNLCEDARKYAEIIKLISFSCNNHHCQDFDGNTALHIAVREGLIEIVEILMPFYSDLLVENKKGKTAVEVAYDKNEAIGDLLMKEIERRYELKSNFITI